MGTRTRGSRSSRDSRKHRGVEPCVQNEFSRARRRAGTGSAGCVEGDDATGWGHYAGGVIEMSRANFEALVSDALDEIPEELALLIENVAVFVEDDPPP